MQDLFDLSNHYHGVLTSGVPFVIRELLAGDQAKLSRDVKQGKKNAFADMLAGCLVSVGNNDKIDAKFVRKMLSGDISYALLKLREHGFVREPGDEIFKFTFEFPLQAGETEKHVEKFEILFDEEYFPVKPYEWVRKKIEEEDQKAFKQAIEAGIDPDTLESPYKSKFPSMFENYEEMLSTCRNREYTFPNTELTIKWKILTAEAEKMRGNQFALKDDLIASVYLRQAIVERVAKDDGEVIPEQVQWEAVPTYYENKFREEYLSAEASIDTIVTVQSDLKPNKVERINLLNTVAFFVPSLGN